jgi:hypothetical protein
MLGPDAHLMYPYCHIRVYMETFMLTAVDPCFVESWADVEESWTREDDAFVTLCRLKADARAPSP